jgi:hypothetical protein
MPKITIVIKIILVTLPWLNDQTQKMKHYYELKLHSKFHEAVKYLISLRNIYIYIYISQYIQYTKI